MIRYNVLRHYVRIKLDECHILSRTRLPILVKLASLTDLPPDPPGMQISTDILNSERLLKIEFRRNKNFLMRCSG